MPWIANAQTGIISIGYAQYEVDEWQVFLPENADPAYRDGFSFGYKVGFGSKRPTIGLSASGFFQPVNTVDSFEIYFSGSDVKLDLGYSVILRPRFIMGPSLGLGGGVDHVHIYNTNNISASQVTEQPARDISITQGKAVAEMALEMYWPFKQQNEHFGNMHFTLGLVCGYSANYAPGNWRMERALVTDGPSGYRGLWFARIAVGVKSVKTDLPDPAGENMQ